MPSARHLSDPGKCFCNSSNRRECEPWEAPSWRADNLRFKIVIPTSGSGFVKLNIAKDFFGKAWSKTRDFWRSLEKGLEGAFIPPPLTLAASGLRSSWIEERSCGATQESIRTEKEK